MCEGRVLDIDHLPPFLFFDVVEAVVDLDPLDPGGEGRTALESLEGKEGLEKDFLGKVLGVGRRPGEVAAVGEHLSAVASYQQIEWSEIAIARRVGETDELCIGDVVIDIQRCLPESIGPSEGARSHIS